MNISPVNFLYQSEKVCNSKDFNREIKPNIQNKENFIPFSSLPMDALKGNTIALTDEDKEAVRQKYLTPNENGKLPIFEIVKRQPRPHKANARLDAMNEEIAKYPDIIEEIYLSKQVGNTPMASSAPLDMYKMNAFLKKYPEIMFKVHFTPSAYGDYPIHSRNVLTLNNFLFTYQLYPNKLMELLKLQDKEGETVLFYMPDSPAYIDKIIDKFYNNPEYVKDLFLTEDFKGNNLAHKINSGDILTGINTYFSDDYKTLKEFYFKTNDENQTPLFDAHNEKFRRICLAFFNHKEDLFELFKIKDINNNFAFDTMNEEDWEYLLKFLGKDFPQFTKDLLLTKRVNSAPASFGLDATHARFVHRTLDKSGTYCPEIYMENDENGNNVFHVSKIGKTRFVTQYLTKDLEKSLALLTQKNNDGKYPHEMTPDNDDTVNQNRYDILKARASNCVLKIRNKKMLEELMDIYKIEN